MFITRIVRCLNSIPNKETIIKENNLYTSNEVIKIVNNVLNEIKKEDNLRLQYGIGSNFYDVFIYNNTIINKLKKKII